MTVYQLLRSRYYNTALCLGSRWLGYDARNGWRVWESNDGGQSLCIILETPDEEKAISALIGLSEFAIKKMVREDEGKDMNGEIPETEAAGFAGQEYWGLEGNR